MTKECFVPRDFKPDTLAVIEQANVIDAMIDRAIRAVVDN